MQLVASVVLAAAVLPCLAQNPPSFMVNSPPACPQCGPCHLSWTETPLNAPFIVEILPAGQTAASSLINPVTINDTSITLDAPFQLNQQVTLAVIDSTGFTQFSSPIPIVSGPSNSCVNDPSFNAYPGVPGYTVGNVASSGSGGTSSGSPSPSSPTTSPTSPASPTGQTTGQTTSPNSSGSSSSPTHTGSPTTSGAVTLSSGLWGSFGLLITILLA